MESVVDVGVHSVLKSSKIISMKFQEVSSVNLSLFVIIAVHVKRRVTALTCSMAIQSFLSSIVFFM